MVTNSMLNKAMMGALALPAVLGTAADNAAHSSKQKYLEAEVQQNRLYIADLESRLKNMENSVKARDKGWLNDRGSQVAVRSTDHEMRLAKLEGLVGEVDVKSVEGNVTRITKMFPNEMDPGRSAWTLTCSALLIMMTTPGLALFYGGLVRVQNVLSTVMQSFSIACLVSVLWVAVGYSLSFSTGGPVIGDFKLAWLVNVDMHKAHPLHPYIPEPLFVVYQLGFAIITPALISGAFADRMRFGSMLIFMALWHLLVYCPLAHANWMSDGFLYKDGVLDFAGGNVVHVAAGCAGLMSSLVIGKRTGFGSEIFHPHNILVSVLGASLLWVGWLAFNGGSDVSDMSRAAVAVLNTQVAAACGSFSWMMTEWGLKRRPSVLGIISGALAGLVAITPGAGYVDLTGAFVTGILSGPACYFSCQLKNRFNFDDALDAFGIHAPAGALGGLTTGLFAKDSVAPGVKGAFYGHGEQIGIQLYGIVVSAGWALVMTWILLKLVDTTVGLRVAMEEELQGLDMVCHGETLNPFPFTMEGDADSRAYGEELFGDGGPVKRYSQDMRRLSTDKRGKSQDHPRTLTGMSAEAKPEGNGRRGSLDSMTEIEPQRPREV